MWALLSWTVAGQIDPRTALLERAGWQDLASGDVSGAVLAFREAVAADPNNPRLHLGAAMAAALERRDADARAACEKALAIDPGLVQARALLGQLLYRSDDLAGAIRTYEALLAASPDEATARAAQSTLERWRREAELHDRMQQAIGSHFTVAFEGPAEADVAAQAIESLDRAYWRIGQLLSVYPSEPISVMLYTTEQFRDITRSPAWAAGSYDGTIRVPMRGALDTPGELDRVLSHEFTHALIRTLARRGVPAWLNEGLATALEGGKVPDEPISGAPIPLSRLSQGFGRLDGRQAQAAYATSARAARRLLDDAGGVAVANLLRDVGEGAPFAAAFEHRMQRSLADFERSLY
jgi:tetratricopeptide (TPR) repeat protein